MKEEKVKEIQTLLMDIINASDPKSVYIGLQYEKIIQLLDEEIEK